MTPPLLTRRLEWATERFRAPVGKTAGGQRIPVSLTTPARPAHTPACVLCAAAHATGNLDAPLQRPGRALRPDALDTTCRSVEAIGATSAR